MEEAAPAGFGGLLQLACRGNLDHTRCSYRDSRVAVGTRRAETEKHPFDASGDGLRIERADLGGLIHPHASPTETREVLPRYRLPIEAVAVVIVALTGHLGGFLSGVNGPG